MAESIYENLQSPRNDGAAAKSLALSPPSKRAASLIPCLAALALLLALVLISVVVLYFQTERKLQELGAAQESGDILHRCNLSYAPREEPKNKWETAALNGAVSGSFEWLACSDIQAYLENLTASLTSLQERYGALQHFVSSIGWKFFDGSAYFFSQEAKTWQEAEADCKSHGTHLTSVASKEEMEYLFREAKGVTFWIGLTDQTEEGNWSWADGTQYLYNMSFWIPRQPDNWQQQEDCVHFRGNYLQSWNDISCGQQYRWICKEVFF